MIKLKLYRSKNCSCPRQFCPAEVGQNKQRGVFAFFCVLNFSRRNANKAQMMAEYAVALGLAIAVFAMMSVFIKRTLQARLRDARNYMITTTDSVYRDSRQANEDTPAFIPYEYEPYYVDQNAQVGRHTEDAMRLLPGGKTGISRKSFNEGSSVNAESNQAPPQSGY